MTISKESDFTKDGKARAGHSYMGCNHPHPQLSTLVSLAYHNKIPWTGGFKSRYLVFTSGSWEVRDQEASPLGLRERGVLLPVAFLLCSHLLERVKSFRLIGVLLFVWFCILVKFLQCWQWNPVPNSWYKNKCSTQVTPSASYLSQKTQAVTSVPHLSEPSSISGTPLNVLPTYEWERAHQDCIIHSAVTVTHWPFIHTSRRYQGPGANWHLLVERSEACRGERTVPVALSPPDSF